MSPSKMTKEESNAPRDRSRSKSAPAPTVVLGDDLTVLIVVLYSSGLLNDRLIDAVSRLVGARFGCAPSSSILSQSGTGFTCVDIDIIMIPHAEDHSVIIAAAVGDDIWCMDSLRPHKALMQYFTSSS